MANWRKIKSPKNDRSLISFREFIHNALASFERHAANIITANIEIDMNFDAPNSAQIETPATKTRNIQLVTGRKMIMRDQTSMNVSLSK